MIGDDSAHAHRRFHHQPTVSFSSYFFSHTRRKQLKGENCFLPLFPLLVSAISLVSTLFVAVTSKDVERGLYLLKNELFSPTYNEN